MNKSEMLKTLIELLYIYSPSKQEQQVIEYIKTFIKNIDSNVKINIDTMGNMYITRGYAKTYPCFNAHMDVVSGFSNEYKKQFKKEKQGKTKKQKPIKTHKSIKSCWNCENLKECYGEIPKMVNPRYAIDCCLYKYEKDEDENEENDEYWYDSISYKYNGYSYWKQEEELTKAEKQKMEESIEKDFEIYYDEEKEKITSNEYRVLGGDDKCGIAMALAIFANTKRPMKLFFSVQEESGLIGATYAAKSFPEWFTDIEYFITLDRRGNSDLLLKSLSDFNAKSLDFFANLVSTGFRSGIIVDTGNNGSSADCVVIRDIVDNTINISVAYHSPHSTSEWIDFKAWKKIYDWMMLFVKEN